MYFRKRSPDDQLTCVDGERNRMRRAIRPTDSPSDATDVCRRLVATSNSYDSHPVIYGPASPPDLAAALVDALPDLGGSTQRTNGQLFVDFGSLQVAWFVFGSRKAGSCAPFFPLVAHAGRAAHQLMRVYDQLTFVASSIGGQLGTITDGEIDSTAAEIIEKHRAWMIENLF